MIVLAVDTAGASCAACLYDSSSERIVARWVETIGRGHAERLFPVIDAALAEAGLTYAGLGRLAVTIGPGSFTGIRVGVAAMRGLALALDIPLTGVTVLECMARTAVAPGPLLVALDARRDEVYAQLFSAGGAAAGPPLVLSRTEARALAEDHGAALYGSAAPLLSADGPHPLPVLGDAGAVEIADLAALAAGREPEGQHPAPLYLRPPDAKPQDGFALPRRPAKASP